MAKTDNHNNTEKPEAEVKRKITFAKAKILKLRRYKFRADLLNVLLEDSRAYTLNEVDALIENFMKGKVK